MRRRPLLTITVTVLAVASLARADPWLAPGDEGLRSDIQLLADAGVLRGPVTTWPLSWPDIARDVLGASEGSLDAGTALALQRVRRLARAAASTGFAGAGYRVAGAYEPSELRSFADTPREEGEIALRASWLASHLSLNLQGAIVARPDDDQQLRVDGSYLGLNIGNFMISAGFMERWWGPGWDSSLILSTNARPIPSITVERNYTDPFKTKLLSWIGPWRASIAVGEAEQSDVAVPKVRFLAARVNFKPRPWLEFGLTRTAQWCGAGRPCGWSTFKNMILGHDNQVTNGSTADQPGNQMAGYDARVRSPWRALPLAFYTQWIGEDEAGGLPAKFLGLFGLESWRETGLGTLRLRMEYADTACSFSRTEPDFNCAYRNSVYPQGYAYRGRIIGDSMDNDSRRYAFGAILDTERGDVLSLTLRRFEINRDGGPHAISEVPRQGEDVELRYLRGVGSGRIVAGLGYQSSGLAPDPGTRLRGYVTWQQGF